MLKVFNSLQIVAMFVAWPFLIAWLSSATFPGAQLAFFVACLLYAIGFFAMVACIYNALDKEW